MCKALLVVIVSSHEGVDIALRALRPPWRKEGKAIAYLCIRACEGACASKDAGRSLGVSR